MVHPFNQPSTWAGHASLVGELTSQLTERPACLVTSVGGEVSPWGWRLKL